MTVTALPSGRCVACSGSGTSRSLTISPWHCFLTAFFSSATATPPRCPGWISQLRSCAAILNNAGGRTFGAHAGPARLAGVLAGVAGT